MFSYLVYCIRPFIQEKPMSERKNSKSRRNYLVKCSCPNCTQESEHSFSRVQKVPFDLPSLQQSIPDKS